MAELVSIITPCFNGGKFLHRYFNSILEQSYPEVEVIFVNDGSIDDTEKIALAYGEKLKARGYGFIYLYQENAGQSAAINQGLKVFSGEYLNWMDCDDSLTPDSILYRVNYLKSNPDVGLVLGHSVAVNSKYERVGILGERQAERVRFETYIPGFLNGTVACPCCSSMVRSSMFREAMPLPLRIADPREIGQNYQLFIPIMLRFPVSFVEDEWAYCLMHENSHSRSKKTFEERMHIADVGTSVLNAIADSLKNCEHDKYWLKSLVSEYDCKNRLAVMQHYHRDDNIDSIVGKLKSLGRYDAAARKMVLKIKYPVIKKLSDRVWKLRNK